MIHKILSDNDLKGFFISRLNFTIIDDLIIFKSWINSNIIFTHIDTSITTVISN